MQIFVVFSLFSTGKVTFFGGRKTHDCYQVGCKGLLTNNNLFLYPRLDNPR